jgi:hypothetical protein
MPTGGMTLTHLVLDAPAPKVRYDLAINVFGAAPSRTRAGLPPLPAPAPTPEPTVAPTPAATPAETPDDLEALAEPTRGTTSTWLAPLAIAVVLVAAALALRASRQSKAEG